MPSGSEGRIAGTTSATVQVLSRVPSDPSRAMSRRVEITPPMARADAEIC